MWYSNPPTTTSKTQLTYRTTSIRNCLKSSLTNVLPLRIEKRRHIRTCRRGRDIELVGFMWQIKIKREILAAEFPPEE